MSKCLNILVTKACNSWLMKLDIDKKTTKHIYFSNEEIIQAEEMVRNRPMALIYCNSENNLSMLAKYLLKSNGVKIQVI